MKKYIPAILLLASVFTFSCGNPNNQVNKKTDTLSVGNTDSSGSQPVQPGPGSANAGNATDTIARRNEPAPRIDSVVRH